VGQVKRMLMVTLLHLLTLRLMHHSSYEHCSHISIQTTSTFKEYWLAWHKLASFNNHGFGNIASQQTEKHTFHLGLLLQQIVPHSFADKL